MLRQGPRCTLVTESGANRPAFKVAYSSLFTNGSAAPFKTRIFALTVPGAGAGVLRPSEAWKPTTPARPAAALAMLSTTAPPKQ